MQSRDGGHGASPRNGHPNSHLPIRAKRSTPDSQALPPSRNETIRPHPGARSRPLRQRTPNRCALSNRLAPLTVPQRTADHPEHTLERGERDSQTNPEKDDARIDNEPFHHETHGARAGATTMRKPTLRAHTARLIERARKRNTVAKTHFQSDLSSWVGWYVIVGPYRAVSYDVNTVLLQHTPNLLNIIHIHASNTNAALNLAVTVLNNLDLKRDTVQAENDLPAQ